MCEGAEECVREQQRNRDRGCVRMCAKEGERKRGWEKTRGRERERERARARRTHTHIYLRFSRLYVDRVMI